jgi:hypothetical protein
MAHQIAYSGLLLFPCVRFGDPFSLSSSRLRHPQDLDVPSINIDPATLPAAPHSQTHTQRDAEAYRKTSHRLNRCPAKSTRGRLRHAFGSVR